MKMLWMALFCLVALPAAAQEKEKPYLLVYQMDVGCQPGIMYPEGGCSHIFIDTVQAFDTAQQAIEFMNNDFGGGYDRMRHEFGDSWSQIPPYNRNPRLYKVVAVPINQVKTGEYEDTELKTVKVKRDKKEWRLAE